MRAARAALPLLAALSGACRTAEPVPPPPGPSLSGQVVDIETCTTAGGCRGVSGVRVAFFHDSRIVSETTNPDGAFVLRNVPIGTRDRLLVTDATGRGEFLPVLQAGLVGSTGSDVYHLELYAMRREGGLYAAFAQEAGVDLAQDALYFGQAFVVEGGGMKAVVGASVATTPAGKVRYVDCSPRIKSPPCTEALFDPTRTVTGPFGEFLVVAPVGGDLTVRVTAAGHSFEEQTAAVGAGRLSIGVHKGTLTGKPPDGGPGG